MAIGRTFPEALCKGIRSLEPHTPWRAPAEVSLTLLREKLTVPRPGPAALAVRGSRARACRATKCVRSPISIRGSFGRSNTWSARPTVAGHESDRRHPRIDATEAKRSGASDEELAQIVEHRPRQRCVRGARKLGVQPVFKRVDTCAAEFESFTPYLYSTYEEEDEADGGRPAEDHDSGQRAESHRAGN